VLLNAEAPRCAPDVICGFAPWFRPLSPADADAEARGASAHARGRAAP
jgi:hypothetical protein